MRKYHYSLCPSSRPACHSRSMGCVDRSDSFVHHLLSCLSLRRPIRRSEHRGSTYNTVYSVVKEQERAGSYDNSRLLCAGASATRPHPPGLSCRKYVPLLFISFLGLFFGVWIKFLPEFFSGAEAPAGFLHARSWERNSHSLQFPISSCQERNGR